MSTATRTIVADPERMGEGNWPWVVKVTAPGGETKVHRFGRREQAEQFAEYTRAQAEWDEA